MGDGGGGCGAAGASEASPQGRRGMGGLLDNNLQSPSVGQAFYKVIICMPDGGGGFVITSGGASLIKDLISTPTRRGPTFVRTKVGKIRLGLCPKTPVAGCAGYGLIYGGSRKSIRTAHRIAPKVACGGICPYRLAVPEKIFALFVCSIFSTATDSPPRFIRHRRRSAPNPPTPFPDGGKGARMGWQLQTDSNALGVLGLAEGEGRGGWGAGL